MSIDVTSDNTVTRIIDDGKNEIWQHPISDNEMTVPGAYMDNDRTKFSKIIGEYDASTSWELGDKVTFSDPSGISDMIENNLSKYRGIKYSALDCSHAVHKAYTDYGLDYEYTRTKDWPPIDSITGAPIFVPGEDDRGNVVLWKGHMMVDMGNGQVWGARKPGETSGIFNIRGFNQQLGKPTFWKWNGDQ